MKQSKYNDGFPFVFFIPREGNDVGLVYEGFLLGVREGLSVGRIEGSYTKKNNKKHKSIMKQGRPGFFFQEEKF